MLLRKPIICAEGSKELNLLKYKNCFSGYALDVEIRFYTDLTYYEFCHYLDYGYSRDKINKFELTGKF